MEKDIEDIIKEKMRPYSKLRGSCLLKKFSVGETWPIYKWTVMEEFC